MTQMKLIVACLMLFGLLAAQSLQVQDENSRRIAAGEAPVYRVDVTSKTVKAISYRHRSGSTKIDFVGTDLLPGAEGEAKIESRQGYIEIKAKFKGLKPANEQSAEYLTYVLWAITPEGRTANLGEILLNGSNSKLNVTTELQVFGLVVTAEPYFSVTQPSDLIVMENVVRSDTKGRIEEIDAKYELLQRGQYAKLANPLELKLDKKIPLELYEARNAVQIARSVGAERFASDSFQKAEAALAQAEAYQTRKAGKKPVSMTARHAVQTAEDARAIAVARQEDEALMAERQRSADRQAKSERDRAEAQLETERVTRLAEEARLRAQADAQRVARDNEAQRASAQEAADRDRRDAESRMAAATADAERIRRESEARAAAAASESTRLQLESDSRLLAARVEADRLRAANEAQLAANQAEADRVARQTARLESEKAELRDQLLKQFNTVLQTRDTARGLIVNMSDVLFDTGKHTLRPAAREKLSKVAGIVLGHPGLKLAVEGHTDSVGSDDYNQTLSELRGTAVREFLMGQGMPGAAITMQGMGKRHPVASNDSASGRQQNRRVEIVISGEAIGTEIGQTIAPR